MITKVLSGLPSTLRWMIGFVEKWFRNSIKQLEWVYKKSKAVYQYSVRYYVAEFGTHPHNAWKFLLGLSVLIVIALPLTFLLVFFWAPLKAL